ncbi:hypothetical protein C1H87_04900 [Flavivirga eckloniae]|uniref:DUF4932 domain-containing protein n=2 Tax=Flavivirga eckloniae TaxID=1803846 RepID=A0A2K9PNB8_9FLAO|nr:hypothetical protein C1H87_04900 [Flavivirga eckloniae]
MTFQVEFSKNYATLDFLNNISSTRQTNPYKKAFNKSKYNTEKYNQLLKAFANINIFYSYEFPQYPYGNKIGGNTYFILNRNLLESSNLEEFKKKSFGIIPNEDLNKLYNILVEFQPIYEDLIYIPCKPLFEKQLKNIQSLVAAVDIDSPFKQLLHFHKSNWDLNLPFKMYISPIPDERKIGFTATAFYNLAIAGIPQGFDNYKQLLAVMFHESFHILYDEQSLKVKEDIASWFNANDSKNANYAQLLFNEAITTATANGYLYKNLAGTLPKGNWYNNKYIAEMAQKMYPLVKTYLDEKKQIDQKFINKYIALMDNEFPQWLYDIDHVLMQRYIISESKDAYRNLSKKHRYSNINEYRNTISALTIQEMKGHPITKVIIVTNNNEKHLSLIKNSFQELKHWAPKPNSNFAFTTFLSDKTHLIIINSLSEDISGLLENLHIK